MEWTERFEFREHCLGDPETLGKEASEFGVQVLETFPDLQQECTHAIVLQKFFPGEMGWELRTVGEFHIRGDGLEFQLQTLQLPEEGMQLLWEFVFLLSSRPMMMLMIIVGGFPDHTTDRLCDEAVLLSS